MTDNDDPTVEYKMADFGREKAKSDPQLSALARVQQGEDEVIAFSASEAYGHLALIALRLVEIPHTLDDFMVGLTLNAFRDDYFRDWKVADLLELIERLSKNELESRCSVLVNVEDGEPF